MKRKTLKNRLSKIGVVFLALLLVFGSVPFNLTGSGQVFAAPEDDGVYAEFTNIQYLDGGGNPITNAVAQNAATKIKFDWHVVNNPNTTPGGIVLEPLVYTFPPIVDLGDNVDTSSLGAYGTYTVDPVAGTLTLNFNASALADANVYGTVEIDRTFQVNETTVEIPYEIQLQTTSGPAVQVIYFIPNGGADVSKSAGNVVDKEVTYTIDINTTSKDYGDKNVVVKDAFAANAPFEYVDGSFELYELTLSSDGNHTYDSSADLFDAAKLTDDGDANTEDFAYDLTDLYALQSGETENRKAYRLIYKAAVEQAKISDLGFNSIDVDNTSTLEVQGQAPVTDTATVTYEPADLLTKDGVADHEYNGTEIEWTINVNKEAFSLNNVTISDNMPNGLQLDVSSIQVEDKAGNSVAPDSNGSNASALDLSFTNIDKELIITYTTTTTHDAQDADETVSYDNTVDLNYVRPVDNSPESATANKVVDITYGGLIKKSVIGQAINFGDDKILTYEIVINAAQDDLGKVFLKDYIGPTHHFFKEDSIKVWPATVSSTDGTVSKGTQLDGANGDYAVSFGTTGDITQNPDLQVPGSYSADANQYMMIELNQNVDGSANSTYVVEYQTVIKRKADGTFDEDYHNDARLWHTAWVEPGNGGDGNGNGNVGSRDWNYQDIDTLTTTPPINNSGGKHIWNYDIGNWSNGSGSARHFLYNADGTVTQKWLLQAILRDHQVRGLTFTDTLSDGFYMTDDQFNAISVQKIPNTPPFHSFTKTATYVGSKIKGFEVAFPSDVIMENAKYNIFYETTVDLDEYPSASDFVDYHNTLELTAINDGATNPTTITTRTITPTITNLEKYEGKKEADWIDQNGAVSATPTERIKWSVYLNYLNKDLASGYTITDEIVGNLAFDPATPSDNIEFFSYDVDTDGTIINVTPLNTPPSGTSYGYNPATREVEVKFNSGLSQRLGFSYVTKREGLAQYVYENTAEANGVDLDANIRFAPDDSGIHVQKTAAAGVQYDSASDTKYIVYNITVNDDGNSTIDNLVITDTMPQGMQIDDVANITIQGSPSGTDYSSSFDITSAVDNATGATTYTFTYTGTVDITEQLDITYRVNINVTELVSTNGQSTIANGVQFSGDYSQQGTTTETAEVTTVFNNSSGTGTGTPRGTITVEKVDAFDTSFNIQGATFQLERGGYIYGPFTTDANGIVTFNNMLPGTYVLREIDAASGYLLNTSTIEIVTTDNTPDQSATVQNSPDLRIQINKTDDQGTALPGVYFKLYDTDVYGNADMNLSTLATDSNGFVEFRELDNKLYIVREIVPAGYRTATTEWSVDFRQYQPGVDASYRIRSLNVVNRPNKLGDRVWYDTNENGIQDSGEGGVPGVTVNLLSGGTIVATTTTDANGEYLFSPVANGTYTVEFAGLPAGYAPTATGAGSDPVNDSNGLSSTVVILNGDNMTYDLGIHIPTQPTHKIGNFVWYDDGDGIQNGEVGVPDIVVKLTKPDDTTATTTTDANGYYEFAGLANGDYIVEFMVPTGLYVTLTNAGFDDAIDSDGEVVDVTIADADDFTIDLGVVTTPTYKLGDFVWFDTDADGIQDSNELGVPNVLVELKNSAGDVLATTTTDANGYYEFTGLANGDYAVEFLLPAGLYATLSNVGSDDAVDSDGTSVPVTIADADDLTIDLGLVDFPTYRIGNFVWSDTDADGLQGPNELGVPNVTVTLSNSAGTVIATTTTDAFGYYEFSGLANGDYTVRLYSTGGVSDNVDRCR